MVLWAGPLWCPKVNFYLALVFGLLFCFRQLGQFAGLVQDLQVLHCLQGDHCPGPVVALSAWSLTPLRDGVHGTFFSSASTSAAAVNEEAVALLQVAKGC